MASTGVIARVEVAGESEAARASAAARPSLFVVDPAEFRESFNRRPFLLRHTLSNHPLFGLERLAGLAESLADDLIDYNRGNVPVSIDARQVPPNGLSPAETILGIGTNSSWIVMKRIESDADYNELLNLCLDEIADHSEAIEPGMYERAASAFISSSAAVTPYHLDHETNFLLQIRGHKTIYTFDRSDESVLPAEALEAYFTGSTRYRNIPLAAELQSKATEFHMGPGDVLHIPTTAPHWVKVGAEPSISFSVAFQTLATDLRRNVINFNARMRRLGLKPRPCGQSAAIDGIKAMTYRACRRVGRITGRGEV